MTGNVDLVTTIYDI